MTTNVRRYLTGLKRPYVTLPDLAGALGMSYGVFWNRLQKSNNLPDCELPEANGAFRAGGTMTFTLEAGIEYAERHAAYWEKRKDGRWETTQK